MVAFSRKIRDRCPSCHQKRELLWAERAEHELLEDVTNLYWHGSLTGTHSQLRGTHSRPILAS